MDITEVFYKCAEEWVKEEFDERVADALIRFEKWSDDLNDEENILLKDFLYRFRYYSKKKTRDIIKELSEKANSKYNITNLDSMISIVRKADGKGNSSHEYWLMHRELSGLSKDIYYDSFLDIDDVEWESINNIVFVDDCCGTGTQFTEFLVRQMELFKERKQKKSFDGKTIIYLVVHIIDDAKIFIEDFAKTNKINIEVEYYWCDRKAFCEKSDDEKNVFLRLSKNRTVKWSLGFKKAEALMAFYNNSPNDTLGMFWCDSDNNVALFPRDDPPKAGWKMSNKEKKERRRQQYESKY